ncbi:hypothetical protein PWT90_09674 [Aphanocladium album]|nr:hypothetical protein PWT90_09674 [Aphanocladium album]
MLGLRSVVVEGLQAARRNELGRLEILHGRRFFILLASVVFDNVTPGVLCLGFSLLAADGITPERVYPSLALSVPLQIALYTGMQKYGWMEQLFAALKRVESFLLQPNFTDSRTVTGLGRHAVRCVKLAISPEGCEEAILRNMNFSINKATVTVCIGRSSSGKSTFLQALAGEAKIVEGLLYIESAEVAYCDQDPWLGNVSIRENIVAGLDFDSVRYESVLRLCFLHRDIAKLEEGDAYVTGANGINLSVGQRHRVSLARALYSRVEIIIIDDLWGSLDRKTATSILYLLCGKESGFLRQEKRTVILSTYLVESFDVADQVLIFDGLGNAMLRNRANVDSEFRGMLDNLNSPHELNPEEEDYKQLAAILRSRQIRETFNKTALQPSRLKRFEPLTGICTFNDKVSTRRSTFLLMIYNCPVSATENLTEYLTSIWLEFHASDIRFPILLICIALSNALFAFFRGRLISRVMVPNNSRYLDEPLIRQIFRSTVAYLGAVDHGHLLQHRASRQLKYFNAKADEKLGRKFLEIVDGIKCARPFGRREHNLIEAFALVNQSQTWHYANLCRQGSMLFLCDLHTAFSLTMLVFLATRRPLASSQLSIGLSFWSSLCMSHALDCLAGKFSDTEAFLLKAHEVQDLVQNIPVEDHDSGINVSTSWPERGEVVFERVTANYRSMINTTNPALREISFSVGSGEKLAIAGRTGSGKTSLLLALLGFLHYQGTIRIDGVDISTINRDALRNLLPFDFQYSASGAARIDDETMRGILSDLGIWGTLSRQGGFDALLPAVQLSRSEMQLFGIARAILQRMGRGGKLILMDEATSALDKATDRRVQGALTAAFPGCTFLIITHRQITVGDAQKFLELEDGAVRSFRDARQIPEEDARETQVSHNQLAESAGGGAVTRNATT